MTSIQRIELADSILEVVQPHPSIRASTPGIAWYGYEEWSNKTLHRQESAGTRVVLILETGAPLSVMTPRGMNRHVGGFVAGLDDAPTQTAHEGHQSGVQINLSVLDALQWFGMPLGEIARQVVPAEDVLPDALRQVVRRLPDEVLTWSDRIALVAAAMPRHRGHQSRDVQTLSWILERIHRDHGGTSIQTLAAEVGWSPRRLQRAFKTLVGLSPKRYSRIVRFEALCSLLRSASMLHWADAAERLGFFDQPHLTKEVQSLAGMTPSELANSIRSMTG